MKCPHCSNEATLKSFIQNNFICQSCKKSNHKAIALIDILSDDESIKTLKEMDMKVIDHCYDPVEFTHDESKILHSITRLI